MTWWEAERFEAADKRSGPSVVPTTGFRIKYSIHEGCLLSDIELMGEVPYSRY
jgi:hypothetical protein